MVQRRLRGPFYLSDVVRRWSLVVVVLAVSGCGGANTTKLDRNAYVAKNVALLKAIPVFRGAQLGPFDSEAYRANELPGATTAGFGTTRTDELPNGTRTSAVIAFYRRALGAAGWQVDYVSRGQSIDFRKGDAYADVWPHDGAVAIEVDYDCYKGGPSPVCFGP